MTEQISVTTDTGRFALVPEWVLTLDVSDKAIRLYALLAVRWADRTTGECWPTRKTIADALGCSTHTVTRATSELEDAGALSVVRRRRDDGNNEPNIYVVHRVPGSKNAPTPGSKNAPTPGYKNAPTGVHGCAPNQNQEPKPVELDLSSVLAEPTLTVDDVEPASASEDQDRARRLCEYFIEAMLKADPEAKRPNITKAWIAEADRMVRLDKRDRREIAAVIDWVFTDPAGAFWIPNIRSVPKLRIQFDRLRQQRMAKASGGPSTLSRPVERDEIQDGRIDLSGFGDR